MTGVVESECQEPDADPTLQGQLTRVELQSLQAKRDSGHVTTKNLTGTMMKNLRGLNELADDIVGAFLSESYSGTDQEIDFESFLREYPQARVTANEGGGGGGKTLPSLLKSSTTTLLHNHNEAEKSFYVMHINTYLCEDPFLKNYLPIDPTGNQLFDLIRDGVLLCKLINLAAPGTIDERAINKKRSLNLWERIENHTLCLNSAKNIGCAIVNIGAQDLDEGRPHLVLGLLSQIIKIHLAKTLQHESKDESCSDTSMLVDSHEKMRNGDSQKVCSSDEMDYEMDYKMEWDSGSDADSDIYYLEAFRRIETESEEDEEELNDDDEFAIHSYNQSLEADEDEKIGGDEEKRPEAKHTDDIVDILSDDYEMQVECGFVTRWAFINYLPYIRLQRFLSKLQDTCLSCGMVKFASRPIREFRETVGLATIEDLLDVLKIELVLLIPPHWGYNDEKIVHMCERRGIVYQSCYPFQTKAALKSLACEIQAKVVKRLVHLRRLELPLVREAPTMIFGADMVYVEDSLSIASVMASVDYPLFRKYSGGVSRQPYDKGIIKDLYTSSGGMMIPLLKSFYMKYGRPQRLIFFRNWSEEEDQFGYICKQEIDAIKRACASFAKKEGYFLPYRPSLTYVVVVTHEIWCAINKKELQGTPVFSCRHSTEQISMVAHYCVVHDDNKFPVSQLQALTSRLRTFRHRLENPCLNIVVPAYLAHQRIVEELIP